MKLSHWTTLDYSIAMPFYSIIKFSFNGLNRLMSIFVTLLKFNYVLNFVGFLVSMPSIVSTVLHSNLYGIESAENDPLKYVNSALSV